MAQIEFASTPSKNEKVDDPLNGIEEKMKEIVKTRLISDHKELATSDFHKPVRLLKDRCGVLNIAFLNNVPVLIRTEIPGIAGGFNEAFQQCSKEIKKFEDFSTSSEEYQRLQTAVMASAKKVKDDNIASICLDIIVQLGKDLATF